MILKYLNPKNYSREYQLVLGTIKEYYSRDPDANAVQRDIFTELLFSKITNPKHQQKFQDLIDESLGGETSLANLEETIIAAKRGEVSDMLSVALANRDEAKAADLIKEYEGLQHLTSLEDLLTNEVTVLTADDMESVIQKVTSREGTLRLYPRAIDKRCESLVRGGHHITTYATPEMGKTGLNVTLSAGFAIQDAPGLYLINEDPEDAIYFRHLSCMSGMTRPEIESNPKLAMNRAHDRGFGNIRIVGMAPGNLMTIEALIDKYAPKWVIVDQMINLDLKGDSETQVLTKAVKGLRTLGKKYDVVMVSTTQAGDSAEGKAVLTQGDVYMSNCLAAGEKILMFDGTRRPVEHVRVGEKVMGMDGTARNVLATGDGVAPLYKITHKNGDSYTVNEDHILTLKNSDHMRRAGIDAKSIGDLPLKVLLDKPYLKDKLKGIWTKALPYEQKELPIDPYLMGLWLADGFSHTFSIASTEAELVQHLVLNYPAVSVRQSSTGFVVGFDQGAGRNPNNTKLREMGVLRNKHVPLLYATGSIRQRRELLAGIVDGDGYLHVPSGTHSPSYRIACGHSKPMAEGTADLAKSLGLFASINYTEGNGYLVYVSGDLRHIPCRLRRKQAQSATQIDWLASEITIEKVSDEGVFYGITVDKDERFVLANHIVTHNTAVPAQADVMLGIGASSEQLSKGERTISFPKNKVSGNHNPVVVKFNPMISRYSSIGED